MIIGIDIGGTKIAAGAVRFPSGEIIAERIIPTHAERGGEAILRDVAEIITELSGHLAEPISGIGIGLCELVSPNGDIMTTGTIRWNRRDVVDRLERFAPVTIEADVRAAALAEARFGAGQNSPNCLYVTIGTGISSCLVLEGVPLTGARGATGTIASGPMPVALPPIERFASGPGLVATYGNNVASAQEVLAAAQSGDNKAAETIRRAAEAVGASIGWLINVLDPELVILGGGLGSREGLYRDVLVRSARDHVWWPPHREVPFVSAKTGTKAGMIGAAVAAWIAGASTMERRQR
jgi:glucokinase